MTPQGGGPGSVTVVRAGFPVLVEDGGRAHVAVFGVPSSGAYDTDSATLAQRLVGNPGSAAGLEITLGAVALATDTTVTAAVTGAPTEIAVGDAAVAVGEVFSWQPGAELRIGVPLRGVRNYVAVRGGFGVAQVLGSASHDVLSGLGPAPLTAGAVLPLAHLPADDPILGHAPYGPRDPGLLRIRLGPRDAWFTAEARAALLRRGFDVTADSNRIGIRLRGALLERSASGELPTEPLQRGAIQVPPNGAPIIMGPDHPTTGGYPVIATVVSADWALCGQLRPGDAVRFELDRG